MRYPKVEYELINNDVSESLPTHKITLENDPKNWDDSERTIKRSTKTYDVVTEMSKSLEYTKEGKEFLDMAYNIKDIESDVIQKEYRFNPNTEQKYLNSIGTFDFSGIEQEKLTTKVPFKTGGLNALIQSQFSEKFQLGRTTAINGNEISELETRTIALTSREILLVSQLENTKNSYSGENTSAVADVFIPQLTVVSNSDQDNINGVFGDENWVFSPTNIDANRFFYFNNDVSKTLEVRTKFNIKCFKPGYSTTSHILRIYRYNYDENGDFSFVGGYALADTDFQDYTVEGDITFNIPMDQGDSLFLYYNPTAGSGTGNNNAFEITNNDIDITITENSTREDSNTQAVLVHEAFDRLMEIITGEKGRFYSNFYGRTDIDYPSTGDFAFTGLTTGFWIREFYEKDFQMSLKDLLDSMRTIHLIGYRIGIINGKEVLIVEDLKDSFVNQVSITIPEQVSNVKRKAAKEFAHSSLEFGYKLEGDYEEAMGLDEFNIKSGWTTNLTRVETTYSMISPFTAASYPKEFARRKPKINFPLEDTRYDSQTFILDLKEGLGEALEERVWQDDYETEPIGIFSPDTATGLRLTPARINKRHQWFYSCAFSKFQDETFYFSNSESNQELETKITGEDAIKESDNIKVSDLNKPVFLNKWIEFDYPVNFDINQQLFGNTEINQKTIPNFYLKVEFINERLQKEYGYIFDVKPNKEGKWKLIKAA